MCKYRVGGSLAADWWSDRAKDMQQFPLPHMKGWMVAEDGASYPPSAEFTALPDFTPFSNTGSHAREQTLEELRHVKMTTAKRAAVYSFGATEGLLLDRLRPEWKEHYFEHMFALEPLFEGGK